MIHEHNERWKVEEEMKIMLLAIALFVLLSTSIYGDSFSPAEMRRQQEEFWSRVRHNEQMELLKELEDKLEELG